MRPHAVVYVRLDRGEPSARTPAARTRSRSNATSSIWNLENMDLSQLVADSAYEFLFVWSPLKMKGATGSPGNPVALY